MFTCKNNLFVKIKKNCNFWSYLYFKIPKTAKPKFRFDSLKKFCNDTNRTFLQAETSLYISVTGIASLIPDKLLLAVPRRLFCLGSLVILDVVRCYLWLFTLYINIKIGKNSC